MPCRKVNSTKFTFSSRKVSELLHFVTSRHVTGVGWGGLGGQCFAPFQIGGTSASFLEAALDFKA